MLASKQQPIGRQSRPGADLQNLVAKRDVADRPWHQGVNRAVPVRRPAVPSVQTIHQRPALHGPESSNAAFGSGKVEVDRFRLPAISMAMAALSADERTWAAQGNTTSSSSAMC